MKVTNDMMAINYALKIIRDENIKEPIFMFLGKYYIGAL